MNKPVDRGSTTSSNDEYSSDEGNTKEKSLEGYGDADDGVDDYSETERDGQWEEQQLDLPDTPDYSGESDSEKSSDSDYESEEVEVAQVTRLQVGKGVNPVVKKKKPLNVAFTTKLASMKFKRLLK